MFINRLEINKNRFPLFVLNRLDPRLRLGAGVVCIALAIQTSDYKTLAALIAAALAVLITNGRALWRRLIPVNAYAAMFAAAVISAELRSRKVLTAMKARGFDGVFPVTADFTP